MTYPEVLLKTAQGQNAVVESSYKYCLKVGIAPLKSIQLMYERAKLIGMIDLLDACKIDKSEFTWIFNI